MILGDITEKTDRYSTFKIGPVLCINHGIGGPSLSILLNEVLKLLLYAGATDVILINKTVLTLNSFKQKRKY